MHWQAIALMGKELLQQVSVNIKEHATLQLVMRDAAVVNLLRLRAGSERQKVAESEGERLREAGAINRSLTALGLVIAKLAASSASGSTGRAHVPYRDSRLTFLLQVPQ